jgi:hypothetical protein
MSVQVPEITEVDILQATAKWSDDGIALDRLAKKVCKILRENPLSDILSAPNQRVEPDLWVVDFSETGSESVSQSLARGLRGLGYSVNFYGPVVNPLLPLAGTASHFAEIKLGPGINLSVTTDDLREALNRRWDAEVSAVNQKKRIEKALKQQALQLISRLKLLFTEKPNEKKWEISVVGFSERAIERVKAYLVSEGRVVSHLSMFQFKKESDGALNTYRLLIINDKCEKNVKRTFVLE